MGGDVRIKKRPTSIEKDKNRDTEETADQVNGNKTSPSMKIDDGVKTVDILGSSDTARNVALETGPLHKTIESLSSASSGSSEKYSVEEYPTNENEKGKEKEKSKKEKS